MYFGSDEFNSAIENTHGNAPITRLKFADDEILDLISSMRFYGGSNDSDDISIGTTIMARVEVSAYTDKLLTGREFLLEQGIELADGTMEYMPIGYFTVQKPSGDIDQVTFTAYDRMQKLEKPYSSNLAYPTTSDLVLEEIANICGIEIATPIENPIEITENLKGYTCREILGYIAGIHGFFTCFDRYGKLNVRWYSDTPIEKDLKSIWSFEKSQENYVIEKIEVAKDSETNYISGNGTVALQHSNPYATQDIVDNLFLKLGYFSYMPATIDMLDDLRLDPWDIVNIVYYDGMTYSIPCMTLEHDFKACSTLVKSVGKSESENEYRYTGPTIKYLNRMAAELLVANRVIATKVDAEYVQSHAITTDNLDAITAQIKSLVVEEIDGLYADIKFANIDVANIDVAKIGSLFAHVGLIDRATIVDGHITGFLDAVEVNANKITAGTLVADRILLSGGDKGVLYALNNLGELTSTNADTLDGYILTDRTITADKIVAKSITTNELDVDKIFGNEAVLNKIVSQDAFIDAIETNRIVVGASNKADEAIEKVNKTVKSIIMHYLATTASSGVTTSTSGWTTTVQQINATKKYLWTYQTMTYADGTTTDTTPVISGVYGNEGVDGQPGENGVGITSVTPLYYLKSNTTAPSAPTSAVTSTSTGSGVWTKSVPTYVNNYTYFTCTQTQYTDGAYKWSTVVADNSLTDAYASLENKANIDEVVAVNLLPYPYYESTHTENVITWTVNTDGTIGVSSGTPTADCYFVFRHHATADKIHLVIPAGTYTLSGGTSKIPLSAWKIENGATTTQLALDNGKGATFTVNTDTRLNVRLHITKNTVVEATTIKPMLEVGSVAHHYTEYSKGGVGITNNIYQAGTTLIDGAKIYTGSITANKIDVDDLFAQEITATGTITGATLVSIENNSSKVVIDKGSIGIYDFDTRGEGGFYEVGSIFASGGGMVSASGTWIFENIETTSGANLDTLNSKIPKLLSVQYPLNNINWIKSGSGMYYANIDLSSSGVSTVLAVTSGDWSDLKTTDIITFGIVSGAKIIINSTVNSFGNNANIWAHILYI